MSASAAGRLAATEPKSDLESTKPVILQSNNPSLPVRIPGQQDIAVLAYLLWEKRGSPEGSPDIDWLDAERQLS
jgi:hypothetical protein